MRIFCVTVLTLVSLCCAGQLRVENSLSKNKDSLILYAASVNYLKIYGNKVKLNDIKIENITHGNIEYNGDTVKVGVEPVGIGEAHFLIKDKATNRILKECRYVSVYLPDIKVKVTDVPTSSLRRDVLLSKAGLIAYYIDSNVNQREVVVGYTFKTNYDGKKVVINVKGPKFTDEIRKLLKEIPVNTKIVFSDIRYTRHGCARYAHPDIELTVI